MNRDELLVKHLTENDGAPVIARVRAVVDEISKACKDLHPVEAATALAWSTGMVFKEFPLVTRHLALDQFRVDVEDAIRASDEGIGPDTPVPAGYYRTIQEMRQQHED